MALHMDLLRFHLHGQYLLLFPNWRSKDNFSLSNVHCLIKERQLFLYFFCAVLADGCRMLLSCCVFTGSKWIRNISLARRRMNFVFGRACTLVILWLLLSCGCVLSDLTLTFVSQMGACNFWRSINSFLWLLWFLKTITLFGVQSNFHLTVSHH